MGDAGRVAGVAQGLEYCAPNSPLRMVVFDDYETVFRWRPQPPREGLVSMGFSEYRSMTRTLVPSLASCSAAARQLCKVTPAPINVTWSLALDRMTLAPPIGKYLVRWVEHRVGAASGAHVDDACSVGHLPHQERRTSGVARVQHCRAVDGAHHSQILQGHLRRAVGADLDPGMRAAQPDVRQSR